MHRPFGLRPEGDEHEGPKRYERDEGRTSPPSLGRRRPASSSNQAFRQTLPFPRPWVSQSDYEGPIEGGRSERRRSEARTRDEGFTEDVDSGEPDLASRPLKNRNQPTAAASPAPSVPQDKPVTPPPTPRLDVSLFYNAPIILSRKSGVRAGVPVVTKSDPATASTISSYSPAMGQDHVLPAKFTSPPLLPGLLKCLTDVVGRDAAPTEIQALSLKWIVEPWTVGQENLPATTTQEVAVRTETGEDHFKEILLASETGSGKSIAYLLPVLQALKLSETRRLAEEATPIASKRGLNPRALILAPTHELARQLSGFAKDLLHDVKLRVLCASRANAPTRAARDPTVAGSGKKKNSSASRMKALLSFADDGQMGEFQVKQADLGPQAFPVDVVVGTPMKLLEMVRGRGWERAVEFGGGVATESPEQEDNKLEEGAEGKERAPKLRRGRDSLPGVGKWRSSPEMGLSEVEWVVVDEADVLFDPDFQETTRILLADISKARGRDIPVVPLPVGLKAPSAPTPVPIPTTSRQKEKEKKEQEKEQAQGKIVAKGGPSAITPLNYPFNFLIASATIPKSLSTYLNAYHPGLLRFITESANHLPKTVRTEYVNWSGGNKNADIERRLRKVWAADAADGLGPGPESLGDMSKVLIFCNRNTKVTDLGEFLEEKGIKNVQLSSSSENRKRGNNNHLNGFLKTAAPDSTERPDDWSSSWVADEDGEGEKKEVPKRSLLPIARIDPQAKEKPINDPMNVPHVMITTSLLSRGLDFSPKVNHVFIIDDPRNEIDFLHRAGRTGRAGKHGKVVIFGKLEGRGSQRSKEVRKKIKALRG
ncbi:P-loop containing nucleoside triphosphate hydrolase protein [Mycena vulgaris]|nr:P-loop containing nucleoside triphosphate hydrolase protein [Mycena vulgaris]